MQQIKTRFKKATATKKGKLIFSSILFVLLLAIAGGVVYWQTHKKMIIREKLEAAIEEKSGGFYTIKYETLDLDEITGFLSITNLHLTYDSNKYNAMKALHLDPPTLFNIHIPEISVEGVETPKALIDKEIDGRKLTIKNPSVEIMYTMRGKDSLRNVPTRDVYEQILGNLNQISLDTVSIIGAQLKTYTAKEKNPGIELSNANINLFDVKVDSVANEDTTRLFFAKQASVAFEELHWYSDDRRYKFKVKNVASNSVDQNITIDQFVMDPQKGEEAFVKSIPTQDDRFDFLLKDILIRNIDYNQLLNELVTADSMVIKSATFKIYRDLNIPRDKKNRVGQYPHQALENVPIPLEVKKLIVQNAFVEYKERNNITKNAGKVQFNNVYATISNLTNNKDAVKKNNIMTANVSCRFLNKSPFNVTWKFYLGHPDGRFDINGKMGPIDARDLNPLTEPMGPARIEKGELKGFTFDFTGTDHSMKGTMQLLYDDLKIAVLEKDKGATEWDKKSLTSFVANILIKNTNLRDKDADRRTITVTNERDTNRSLFNLAWKTIFKGVMQTIGAPAKKAKSVS